MRSTSWFITTKGRLFMRGSALIGSFALFGMQYFPHTLGLEKYYELVTMQRAGKPIPLTPNLEKLWSEVLSDLHLSEYHKGILRPFMVFGYDTWHAGCLFSRFGALVGIPTNFVYDKVSSVDRDGIIVNEEPVDWSRKDAKNLLSSLILSNDAKKYAIAREIMMLDSRFIYIESVVNALSVAVYYYATSHWNDQRNLLAQPLGIRAFFYVIAGAFLWGLWAMQRDALTRHYEYVADKKLSELGPNYVNGGVEFYDKVLQRNTALRSLLGAKGNKIYTAKGNDYSFIRQKHLPYTQRKFFFEDICKQFNSKPDNL